MSTTTRLQTLILPMKVLNGHMHHLATQMTTVAAFPTLSAAFLCMWAAMLQPLLAHLLLFLCLAALVSRCFPPHSSQLLTMYSPLSVYLTMVRFMLMLPQTICMTTGQRCAPLNMTFRQTLLLVAFVTIIAEMMRISCETARARQREADMRTR